MRNSCFKLLLLLLVLCAVAAAKEWPSIPPEVWAIKVEAGQPNQGAVILEERIQFRERDTEVHRRIRIFSEAGKGAATIPSFNKIFEMEGRTVQPDGSVTLFNDAKDLVSTSLKVGSWEAKQQSLIPPGLTADCVVDLHYRVGTYITGTWSELPLLSAFPIRRKVIEIPDRMTMGSILTGLEHIQHERTATKEVVTFNFKELPANDPEPYSSPTARLRPRLIFFFQPNRLRDEAENGPAFYWNEVGTWYFKSIYDRNISKGSTYRNWSKALRAGLEGDAVSKAGAILSRLEERIQNGSQLTFAEFAALSRKLAEEKMAAHDLDASVKRERTSATGMRYLFFQLLVDEGLDPKILMVTDRNERDFRFEFPNIYQFTDTLIGVASPSGGMAWFDPSTRYFPAGIVPPKFQGTRGLLVNPKTWKCAPYDLGIQGSRVNVGIYEYDLNLAEEETFALRARFTGYPEFAERNKFFSLEAKEQERKLKEEMEPSLKGYTITKVAVEHATDVRKNLAWTLGGAREAEEGRHRVFHPFPGLPSPLTIPDAWPELRKSPIVLSYCRVFGAISQFKIPKGWRLVTDPDQVHSNEFGTVAWKLTRTTVGEEDRVKIIFSVEVGKIYAPAESYRAFREFMAWIESATRRSLTLERLS